MLQDKTEISCKIGLQFHLKYRKFETQHVINIKFPNNLQTMYLSATISLPYNVANMWIKNCTKNTGHYKY